MPEKRRPMSKFDPFKRLGNAVRKMSADPDRAPRLKTIIYAVVVLAISGVLSFAIGSGNHNARPAIQTPDGTSASQSTTTSAGSLPDYSGTPSVSLGETSGLTEGDIPDSTILPELDRYGRCGAVTMVVGLDTAPQSSERRGSIGMVKPSGWHTIRDDSLDGKYLYNRCHLIAWCLSGMNAEERNLITGTRYMNVEGMLPYETKVLDHIRSGGGRVLYKVTPDFRDNELVARGVRIRAYSIADKGKSLNFDVYCYNVQPGYKIDYLTGKASKS